MKYGIRISVTGKENCFYNAVVEILKFALVWRTIFQARAKDKHAIGRYIKGFHNPIQRHSTLGYIILIPFERPAGKTVKRSPQKRSKSKDRVGSALI